MTEQFDIAIVGAGPVGLALALTLARFAPGVSVALLDRRPLSVQQDARASALSVAAKRAFEALGLWDEVAAEAEPVRAMKITDSGTGDIARPLFLHFEGDARPGEPFAHMVPNRVMNAGLIDALKDRITVLAPVEITGFSAGPASAELTLKDGGVVSATLVVASDGANSALRGMAGIGTIAHDYKQMGVVTTISHELPHDGVAYEHFLPAGPFASLPLKGNRSSLVWTETPARAAELKALSAENAALAIEAAMGSSLGLVTVEEPLQAFPLKLQIARAFVSDRLALIGDAAHVIHPVAGQGLNLGFKDVAALAEAVIDAMRLGLDFGAADVLDRYQRWRRFDTALMAMVTDGMNRLFSNDVAPVRALRDLGLSVVERLPPVKDALIAQAAGVSRSGPRLLQGLGI
jgi:2-octaprenyl-6-methoxyphenol hydroxylase